jgi:hypothetical protein
MATLEGGDESLGSGLIMRLITAENAYGQVLPSYADVTHAKTTPSIAALSDCSPGQR